MYKYLLSRLDRDEKGEKNSVTKEEEKLGEVRKDSKDIRY